MRRAASALFLFLGVFIASGAYGHGFVGRLNIDRELDKFPIASDTYTMLYVVWYFVSGCMLTFGLTIIWAWVKLRRGDRGLLPAVYLIALLYMADGIGGMIYRHGDPFMGMFLGIGALLLASAQLLDRTATPRAA